MKKILLLALVLAAGCGTSGPPAPPLAGDILFVEHGFEDKSLSIAPTIGVLTLTISADGDAGSVVKRQLLTDIERSRTLSNSERWELHTKAEAWAAKAPAEPSAAEKSWGSLRYGARRITWQKGDSLSPELADLVHYLKAITNSLHEVRKRG